MPMGCLQDSIHPECVLQAPYEIFAFQYNPSNPEIVAAGCYNGQVCALLVVAAYTPVSLALS